MTNQQRLHQVYGKHQVISIGDWSCFIMGTCHCGATLIARYTPGYGRRLHGAWVMLPPKLAIRCTQAIKDMDAASERLKVAIRKGASKNSASAIKAGVQVYLEEAKRFNRLRKTLERRFLELRRAGEDEFLR